MIIQIVAGNLLNPGNDLQLVLEEFKAGLQYKATQTKALSPAMAY